MDGTLSATGEPASPTPGMALVRKLVAMEGLSGLRMAAVVSEDVDIHDKESYIWGVFTRFDCERDVLFTESTLHGISPVYRGLMGIDATWKTGYPLPLTMPDEIVRLNHRLTGIEQKADGAVRLIFDGGATIDADAVVAADGVNSVAQEALFGASTPNFTGRIAYRTVFPASRLNGLEVTNCTKWWGEDRHIVVYPVKPDRSEIYFVTSQPEPGFEIESWSAEGDVNVVREAFSGFHEDVRRLLAACPSVHKRPLVDREPLEHWVEGNVALMGDACHPMTPYMAQGAAMAIEDAAILARCLEGVSDRAGVGTALARYETTRKARTSKMQLTSRQNVWGKGATDTDWVYGYNAWTAPLSAA